MFVRKILILNFAALFSVFIDSKTSFADHSKLHARQDIVLKLLQELQVQHAIIVGNIQIKVNVQDCKIFSNNFIPITFENPKSLENYLIEGFFPDRNTALICEIDSSKIIDILNNLDQYKLLHRASRFIWLLFLDFCPLKDENEDYNIPYDCEFLLICPPKNSTSLRLIETFKVKNLTFFTDYGSWDDQSGLAISNLPFYGRRMNLSNATFSLTSVIKEKGCHSQLYCFVYEFLTDVARKMNFRYRILQGKIGQFKGFDFHHRLVGFHKDFGPDDEEIEFVAPFFKLRIEWYIKYPKTKEQQDYYLKPFAADLWAAIMTFILVGIALMFVLINVKKSILTHVDCVYVPLDPFLNQDGTRSMLSRMIVFSLRFAALFIIATYSATVTSFITIRIPEIPFKNLQGFIKNGKYTLAKIPGEVSEAAFVSSDPIMRFTNQKFSRSFKNYEEVLSKVCTENLALIIFSEKYMNIDKKCDLLKIEKPLYSMFSAMPIAANSPFTKILKYHLLYFHSGGFIRKLQKYSERSDEKVQNNIFQSVELYQTGQIIAIGMGGVILSAFILLCELTHRNYGQMVEILFFLIKKIQKRERGKSEK